MIPVLVHFYINGGRIYRPHILTAFIIHGFIFYATRLKEPELGHLSKNAKNKIK